MAARGSDRQWAGHVVVSTVPSWHPATRQTMTLYGRQFSILRSAVEDWLRSGAWAMMAVEHPNQHEALIGYLHVATLGDDERQLYAAHPEHLRRALARVETHPWRWFMAETLHPNRYTQQEAIHDLAQRMLTPIVGPDFEDLLVVNGRLQVQRVRSTITIEVTERADPLLQRYMMRGWRVLREHPVLGGRLAVLIGHPEPNAT